MIRDTFEIIGDLVYAYCLFCGYMLRLVWALAIIAVIPAIAHAGGYGHCYTPYVSHEVVREYTPTTIIEHQNNEIFYSVGAGVRDYAVAQQNVAAAQAGQVERQIEALQSQLVTYRQQSQPVATPAQLVYAVPVTPVAAACLPVAPGQTPMPAHASAAPAASPSFDPNGVVEAKCYSCHSGPNPKGRLALDRKLTCEQALRAIAAVTSGKMPKNGPELTDAEKVAFNAEMLKVSLASKSVAQESQTKQEWGPPKPWPPKDLPITPAPLPLPTPENTTDAENY